MLLAIDIGNTNTVLGLYRLAAGTPGDQASAAPLADWRITTHRTITVDELGILFRDLFALRSLDIAQVTGIAISSVVPPLDSIFRRAAELYFRVKPLFVEPGVRTGLPILTDNPAEVGADRIVNCVAAHELFRNPALFKHPAPFRTASVVTSGGDGGIPRELSMLAGMQIGVPAGMQGGVLAGVQAGGTVAASMPASSSANATRPHPPVIVVDFGTATTFDVISPRGEYMGGAIAPGLGISADALFVRAARLPRVDIRKPVKVIGTNTVDHLQIGLYYGYIGLVDGILERMIAELGPDTQTIATGGLAPLIAGGSKYIGMVDEMLTLTGLRLIYERNLERTQERTRHARSHPGET